MMTNIHTHTVVYHNCIPNLIEAEFRPRAILNVFAAVRNFFSPHIQELGSYQSAELANFRPVVSRGDMTAR